jgi:hypothetical protein
MSLSPRVATRGLGCIYHRYDDISLPILNKARNDEKLKTEHCKLITIYGEHEFRGNGRAV